MNYDLDVAVLEKSMPPASKVLNAWRKAPERTASLRGCCSVPSRLLSILNVHCISFEKMGLMSWNFGRWGCSTEVRCWEVCAWRREAISSQRHPAYPAGVSAKLPPKPESIKTQPAKMCVHFELHLRHSTNFKSKW